MSIRKLHQRTTIGIKMSTKSRLDKSRAPGQCYDGFLCQLVDTWEEIHKANNILLKEVSAQESYSKAAEFTLLKGEVNVRD